MHDIVTNVVLTNRRGLRLDYSKFDRIYEAVAESARVVAKEQFRARRKKMPELSDEALIKRFLKGSFLEDWGRWIDQECKVEGGYASPATIWWSGTYSKKLLPVFQNVLSEFEGEAEIIVRLKSRHHVKYHLANFAVTKLGKQRPGPPTILPRLNEDLLVVPQYRSHPSPPLIGRTMAAYSVAPVTGQTGVIGYVNFGPPEIVPPPLVASEPEPMKDEPEQPKISRYARLGEILAGVELVDDHVPEG